MPKNIIILISVILLILVIYRVFFYHPDLEKNTFLIKGKQYNLEVAVTLSQKEQGLMNRPQLCNHCGMIFVSNLEMPQIFWMKNTLIPLDIIFLDKEGTVINIANAVPEPGVSDSQLKLYHSSRNAKYVIELNAGDTQKLQLIPGDKIDLSTL